MNKTDALIIHGKQDGGITILIPSTKTKLTLEQIQQKDVPEGAVSRIIPRTDMPDDGFFRDAWDANFDDYVGVFTDMDKAKVIAQDVIREERAKAFEVLDVEYMRASESQDTEKMAEIVAVKQVLRDLPASPEIQEAKTPEELKRLAETAVSTAVQSND